MARAKDRDEDMFSVASSNHSRKRKRVVSPPSDSSDSDVPVTKSKSKKKNKHKLDSDTSTARPNGKRSSHSTNGTKPSAAKKGKSTNYATTDSDDDSDEDIVVVASTSKASQSTSYKPPSPSKPSYKHRDEKKTSLKDRRVSQVASDNEDEVASRTSSHKSAKTTSSKASASSFSKKSHLGSLFSHKSARDALKSDQVQVPSRKHADILGDHNFAPAKSVSPVKAHNGFHAAETSQDAIKIKRLQGQNETLKRKFDESEDRFNEASSRSEELQAQVKQLEYQIKTMEKRHDENVAKVKERFAGSGDTERATQARIEELEHNFSIATNKHVEVTLALHAELKRAQRELDTALGNDITPRQPAWLRKAEMESTRRADELEAQLKQQKLDFENKIESLESELALQQVNPQLAAKEREVEAVRLAFTRELEKKDDALKTLKTMYNMDKQAWSAYVQTSGSSSDLPASQDVERLQKIVTAQNKQLKDADLRLQAVADTYEARIKQMDHIARELLRKNRRELEDLESSRSSMEFDRSRFQGQVVSLKREREKQDSVITELRKFKLDYDRLRAEHPDLQKKYDKLLDIKNLVYEENENLKRERLIMHAQDQQRQSKMDEYVALLQAGQLQEATPSDLLEKYKLLKSTYSMEREKYKRKIKKLERKLSIAQGGPVPEHLDGHSLSNGMSATPATSTSEEESSHPRARADRHYSTQEHADLEDILFDDTISSKVSRRDAKRVSPRSPSPFEVLPSKSLAYERLSEQVGMVKQSKKAQLEAYEQAKPSYQFPPTIRERKADTKVPRHRNRVYVRSECHTPYVPDEMVSDSDDEFLEWESQAYAKSQAGNPDRPAAVVNTCWNRHILDIRCNRVRSSNLHFCIEFVESYGPLIHSREATPALLKHILKLVDLGQLTADEGGTVIRSYHQAV